MSIDGLDVACVSAVLRGRYTPLWKNSSSTSFLRWWRGSAATGRPIWRAMWPAQMLPKLPEGTQKATCSSLFSSPRSSPEVIDDLRRDPRPVDRIDRADLCAYLALKAWSLETAFTMSWASSNMPATAMLKMLSSRSEYICALEGAHLAVRRQHEHAHAVLAAHRVLGAGAGVARGGAEDVDGLAALREHVLEQVAEQLHRHVLKASVGPLDSSSRPSRPSSASFPSAPG